MKKLKNNYYLTKEDRRTNVNKIMFYKKQIFEHIDFLKKITNLENLDDVDLEFLSVNLEEISDIFESLKKSKVGENPNVDRKQRIKSIRLLQAILRDNKNYDFEKMTDSDLEILHMQLDERRLKNIRKFELTH